MKIFSLLLLAFFPLSSAVQNASDSPPVAEYSGVQVGDMYKIEVDLPGTVVRKLVVTDVLPRGLIYKEEGLKIYGAASSATTTKVSDPNNGTEEVVIEWSFDEVNNTLDQDLTIQSEVLVAAILENQDGAVLAPCRASLRFEDEAGLVRSDSEKSKPLMVVEPCLMVYKSAAPDTTGPNDLAVIYTISLSHSPLSHSDAFDVEVTDSVPHGFVCSPDSIEILSGPPGTAELVDPSTVRWRVNEVGLSWNEDRKVLLRYRATVDEIYRASSEEGATDELSAVIGWLNWTSAAGDNPDERAYSTSYDKSAPELSVSIGASPKWPKVADTITYTYSVGNLGEDQITNLTLNDDRLGRIDLDRATLLPGEVAMGTIDYVVYEGDLPGPLENEALALGEGPLDNPVVGIGQISVDLSGFSVTKTADKKTLKPGETLNYTICLQNRGPTVENVTVRDVFDGRVETIYTSPPPDPDGIWRFEEIGNVTSKNITLKVKVPETQDFEFMMSQGVSGEGFVNVANDYKTAPPSYTITNRVYVTFTLSSEGEGNTTGTATDSESVTVVRTGTELSTREHGSGTYDGEEEIELLTEKKSISMDKDVSATYGTTTLGLYRNRSVTYSSRWTQEAKAKNRITGTSMSESYRYATSIDRESRINIDQSETVMEINSEFDGMGHVGILKMPSSDSTAHDKPAFESREDYVGSFKVLESVTGSSSTKTSSGTGFVAADKRIDTSQRSYESGTGNYSSDEEISAGSNYIAKDLSLVYAPASQNLTDDFSLDLSMKWKEGTWSRNQGESLIGEEYTGVTQLDKETVARGLNEMETDANFSGKARFRAVLEDMVDSDEEFEGEYSIQRKTVFQGVAKYNRPHLKVAKEGSFHEETVIENHQEKTITVATYTITVENDGNRTLGPIYVTDFFPPRAKFINASLRPSERTESRADWVLTHLAIGDRSTIVLNLDVTEYRGDELVNRVEACGVYDDEQICAANFTAIEIEWLKCCPSDNISVSKTARLDETSSNVVRYRIVIQNSGDATRVATVTDNLPDGMVLLDSVAPFSSYDGGVVTWNLIDLGPMENKTIDYRAEALWSGRFENQVMVDARSVDGSATSPVYAAAVITLEEFEGEIPEPGWQPPNWDLSHVESPTYFEMCEEVFL